MCEETDDEYHHRASFTTEQHLRLAALDQANRHYNGDATITVTNAKQFFAFLSGEGE